ncbi:UNVERIFIED_CONTAM: hypothetical protein FKN15_005572 [Acipenser sinensis]
MGKRDSVGYDLVILYFGQCTVKLVMLPKLHLQTLLTTVLLLALQVDVSEEGELLAESIVLITGGECGYLSVTKPVLSVGSSLTATCHLCKEETASWEYAGSLVSPQLYSQINSTVSTLTLDSLTLTSREGENLTCRSRADDSKSVMFPEDKVVRVGTNMTFCCVAGRGERIKTLVYGAEHLPCNELGIRSKAITKYNLPPSNPSGTNIMCELDPFDLIGTVVFVGYPPDDQQLECETRDLQNIVCYWSPGRQTMLLGGRRTFYTLTERISGKNASCHRANDADPNGDKHKCHFPVISGQQMYKFLLKAKNPLGEVETNYTLNLYTRAPGEGSRLGRAMRASSASSMAGPSVALGSPEPLPHDLSQDPLLDIPDAQVARSRSPSSQARRMKCSKQARDIMDLKTQMAQGGWGEASQPVLEDALSIAASGDEASSSDMQVGETPTEEDPGFEVASEASAPPLSGSVSALMGHTAAFLQVHWTPPAEPRQSVFWTQAMVPRPQQFPALGRQNKLIPGASITLQPSTPGRRISTSSYGRKCKWMDTHLFTVSYVLVGAYLAFLDFMEEVRSSWDHLASSPSMLKHAAPLASLEGMDKLGLTRFPPVDSAIAALVKAQPVVYPYSPSKVTVLCTGSRQTELFLSWGVSYKNMTCLCQFEIITNNKEKELGTIVKYEITWNDVNEVGEQSAVAPVSVNSTELHLNFSDYVISVSAVNSVGSSPSSQIRIPGLLEEQADEPSIISGTPSGFNLSWSPGINETCGYIVEWCLFPDTLDCNLQWEKVPPKTTHTVITSAPRRAVKVKAEANSSHTVTLRWEDIPVQDRQGFIRGYRVYYVPQVNYSARSQKSVGIKEVINITDPDVRNVTVTNLHSATYEFTVKAYTAGGEGIGEPININLVDSPLGLILAILVPLGVTCFCGILLGIFCYTKRNCVKETFYPDIPKPEIHGEQWSVGEGRSSNPTFDVKPFIPDKVRIIESVPGKDAEDSDICKVEINNGDSEQIDVNSSDTSTNPMLPSYYPQIVDSYKASSDSSSGSMDSCATQVTYSDIQPPTNGSVNNLEVISDCGYKPQMRPHMPLLDVNHTLNPQHLDLPEQSEGYQPQLKVSNWSLESPEVDEASACIGSPTSVNSTQFLLPDQASEEGQSTRSSSWKFSSFMSSAQKR